jgi:hypothetical protein
MPAVFSDMAATSSGAVSSIMQRESADCNRQLGGTLVMRALTLVWKIFLHLCEVA